MGISDANEEKGKKNEEKGKNDANKESSKKEVAQNRQKKTGGKQQNERIQKRVTNKKMQKGEGKIKGAPCFQVMYGLTSRACGNDSNIEQPGFPL